jgi:hypothetical protein
MMGLSVQDMQQRELLLLVVHTFADGSPSYSTRMLPQVHPPLGMFREFWLLVYVY